jgi:hypothetical protein
VQKRKRDNTLHVVRYCVLLPISRLSLHGVLVLSRVLLILAVCSIHHPRSLLLSLPSEASHGFSIQPSHVLGFTGHSVSSGGLAVRGVQLCETGCPAHTLPQSLRLVILHSLVAVLLSSTLAQLPTPLDERLPARLPSSQRLRLHLLYRQHWHLSVLACRTRTVCASPPTVPPPDSQVQRFRVWCPCLDLLCRSLLAILATTLGVGRGSECQETRWPRNSRHLVWLPGWCGRHSCCRPRK